MAKQVGFVGKKSVYVIRNGKLAADYETVNQRLGPVLMASIWA